MNDNLFFRVRDAYTNISRIVESKYHVNIGRTRFSYSGKYLVDISDRISSRFVNTRVDVYLAEMEVPNAFTFPFREYTSTSLFSMIRNIFVIGPIVDAFWGSLEGTIRSGIQLIARDEPTEFFPSKNQADIHVPRVKCFIAKQLVEMLSQNELDAILIHEVGHNTHVMQQCILYAIATVTFGSWFTAIVNSGEERLSLLCFMMFLNILLIVLNLYMGRKFEIHSDDLAIKMGYGRYLADALRKLNREDAARIESYIKEKKMTPEKEAAFRDRIKKMRENDVHMHPDDRDKYLRIGADRRDLELKRTGQVRDQSHIAGWL